MKRKGYYRNILIGAVILHSVWSLCILSHVVTWGDPGAYSYNAFDLLFGREMGTNQHIERYISSPSQNAFIFNRWDITMMPGWSCIVVGLFYILGVSLFSAKLASLMLSICLIVVVYYLSREIFSDSTIPYQIALFLCLDYQLFWLATMARPDMASAFFVFTGLYFMVRFLKKQKVYFGVVTAICYFIALMVHGIAVVVILSSTVIAIAYILRAKPWTQTRLLKLLACYGIPLCLFALLCLFWYATNRNSIDSVIKMGGQFHLWTDIKLEWVKKIYDAYARRFLTIILFLIGLFSLKLLWSSIKRKRQDHNLMILLMTILIFVFGVVLDTTHAKPHLIYYIPFFSTIFILGIRECVSLLHSGTLRKVVFSLIVFNILLPRIGKTYQIITDWEGTSYNRFIENMKQWVPPHSVIMGDVSLIFGLYNYGVKILDLNVLHSEDNTQFLQDVDYLVLHPLVIHNNAYWDKIERYFQDRLIKIDEYFAKRIEYGYSYAIYKIDKSP